MTDFVTGIGIAQYPWLSKADTKFQELGEYKCNLILEGTDATELVEQIDQAIAQKKATEKAKKTAPAPYVFEEDDNGTPTGRVIFKFKNRNRMNRNGDLWDRKPLLVDTKGNRADVDVGGGSKVRIKGEMYAWANPSLGAGVSLQMKAVQIVELEVYTPKETFDAIEGGFEAKDEEVSRETADGDLF